MEYMLTKRNHLENPFDEFAKAGKQWLKLFLKYHKHNFRYENPSLLQKVDAIFHQLYTKGNYPLNHIHQVDESRFTVVQSKIPVTNKNDNLTYLSFKEAH